MIEKPDLINFLILFTPEYYSFILPFPFQLNGGKVSEITIARQVPKESVEKLVSYDLPGVYYSRDNTLQLWEFPCSIDRSRGI